MEKREEYRGFWFSENTPKQVRDIIANAHETKTRLRFHYGDKQTGELWLEEFDVIGRIGRSTGTQKIPLLIKTSRSYGGGALLDHCILGIQCAGTKKWLYRAENLRLPEFRIETPADMPAGYHFSVIRGNEAQANFKTREKAQNYIAFMHGERMRAA